MIASTNKNLRDCGVKMNLINKARDMGFKVRGKGSWKQTCPYCSAGRKKKSDPCMSVKYDGECVLYKCHNCGEKGIITDGTTNKRFSDEQEPKSRASYWSVQAKSRRDVRKAGYFNSVPTKGRDS